MRPPEHCAKCLRARDYADAARGATKAMHEQVGVLRMDEDGLALRGVLVRHLVMPGMLGDTEAILRWLVTELSPDTHLNLMDQYRPAHRAETEPQFADITQRLSRAEFGRAVELAQAAGLWRLDSRRLS